MSKRKKPRGKAPSPVSSDDVARWATGGRPNERVHLLGGNLTVADARHLLKNEGGEITPAAMAVQALSCAVVLGTLAWSVWRGNSTAWTMVLPLVAQYLTLLVTMPLVYLVMPLTPLRREVRLCVMWLAVFGSALAGWVAYRAHETSAPFAEQFGRELAFAWGWLVERSLHWPILAASLGQGLDVPQRILNLKRYGPPYMGASLGCGMRLGVAVLGVFGLPWVLAAGWGPQGVTWALWGMLVVADVAAIWVHWDIQRALKAFDAKHGAPVTTLELESPI